MEIKQDNEQWHCGEKEETRLWLGINNPCASTPAPNRCVTHQLGMRDFRTNWLDLFIAYMKIPHDSRDTRPKWCHVLKSVRLQ